jgi:hypothetical protein
VIPVPKVPDQVTVPPVQPVAVNVALSVPQIDVLLAVIVGATEAGLAVMVTELEARDVPQLVVQVAVYVPAPTSLVVPVPNPPDQVTVPPEQPVAVRTAFSVPQTVNLLADILGAVGTTPFSILIILEARLIPQEFLHFAV